MDLKAQVIELLQTSSSITAINKAIKSIEQEDLYLAGGYIRNVIWNKLHHYYEPYGLEDCDIIFYNPFNTSKNYEFFIQHQLAQHLPQINWSVKNQARIHTRNNHRKYINLFNALLAFPETCSSIAINKNWDIISPYGISDLLNLEINPTDFAIKYEIDVFRERVRKKSWLIKWKNLNILSTQEIRSNRI